MPVIDTGDGQMDVISRLLKDRILLLGQQVDDEVANVLVAQLLYLANEDPKKDITLYINSPGGSVSAGMVRYRDTLRMSLLPRRAADLCVYCSFVYRQSMIQCNMFHAMFQPFVLEWLRVWEPFCWAPVLRENVRRFPMRES